MIAVTFAVHQESGVYRRALRSAGGRLDGEEIRVAHLGVGPLEAGQRVARLLTVNRPRMLICAGFAGGLAHSLRPGDLVIAENFSALDLLARARELSGSGNNPQLFFGALATRPLPLETTAAKATLARETGALAVDMETAAVASACHAACVPLLAVRAISDAAATPLPVPFTEWFDLRRQRPRPWRLLDYLVQHPAHIRPFATFLRNLPPCRRALADFLGSFLQQTNP